MAEKNTDIEARISSLETKFEMFMRSQDEKFNNFMQEMRDRDNQRAEDIRELRQRQDAAQAKHDADMKEMNQRFYAKFDAMDAKVDANFKEFAKQLHSNFVQTMIGVGAIMAAIGGLLIAALK